MIGLLNGGQGGLLGAEANLLGGILGGDSKGSTGGVGGLLGGIINAKVGLVDTVLGGLFNGLTGGLTGGNTQQQTSQTQVLQKPANNQVFNQNTAGHTMTTGHSHSMNNQNTAGQSGMFGDHGVVTFNQNPLNLNYQDSHSGNNHSYSDSYNHSYSNSYNHSYSGSHNYGNHNHINQSDGIHSDGEQCGVGSQNVGVYGNQGSDSYQSAGFFTNQAPAVPPLGDGYTVHVDGYGNVSSHLGTDHYQSFNHQGVSYPMYGTTVSAINGSENQSVVTREPVQVNAATEDAATEEHKLIGDGPLGFLGPVFKGVHHIAEYAIDITGLQPLFAPIDAAIVHPLLWDPLSMLTGYDVSDHPEGIPDVEKPDLSNMFSLK